MPRGAEKYRTLGQHGKQGRSPERSSSLGAVNRVQENKVFLSEGRREQEWLGVWRMVVSGSEQ